MRSATGLLFVLGGAAVVLSGCGYTGDPKAPALRRPERVANLTAVERGSKIVVTFVLPAETTDDLPIKTPPDVEMRIGPGPDPWEEDAWVAHSDRIPVPAWEPMHSAVPKRRGAVAASGSTASLKRKAAKQTAVAAAAARMEWYSRNIEIDAAKYVGKPVLIGVKVHGPKGRDDGWSFVTLEVLPVLPVPLDVKAADAPNAIHLQWTAAAPAFRIFRKLPADAEWTQIGESSQASFDDTTFTYGKTWEYYIQSIRKTGTGFLESERSETISFAPTDKFPPGTPAGLSAIAGTQTIELSWNNVTDADLAGYRVYRGGVKIADGLQSAVYSDKDVSAGSRYRYEVSAVDQAGNESARSNVIEITME